VRRTVYPIADDTHAIAVSVDRGTIDTGKRSQPLCEVELEIERGNLAELFDVARKIAKHSQLGLQSRANPNVDTRSLTEKKNYRSRLSLSI
jgi:triphosphatase